MYSAEVTNLLANLRMKVLDGSITPEEMRNGIVLMRQDRLGAQAAAATSKSRSKAPARSAEDMLAEL